MSRLDTTRPLSPRRMVNAPPVTFGYPMPAFPSSAVRVREETINWGMDAAMRVDYQTRGPRFTAIASVGMDDHRRPYETRNGLMNVCWASIVAQVAAHNAIVEPIPNGAP